MTARIYRPARSAMQSGSARTKNWILEFEPASSRSIEPLMGWTSSDDTMQQVRLRFATREEAVAYAERNGISYQLCEAAQTSRKLVSYSDNFKVSRVGQWTH